MLNQSLCHCENETYLLEFHKILKTMVCKMTSVDLRNSISYNFIIQMIPHHEAAIKMSENILAYTKDNKIAQIAENIITTQKRSIQNMLAAQRTCSCYQNYCNELHEYQNGLYPIFDTMFMDMANAHSTLYVNCNFLREMIPHHEGAVKMSKLTLSYRICPQLQPILQSIITEQEQGIKEMQNLLYECPDMCRHECPDMNC